jgi:hypothetical protein
MQHRAPKTRFRNAPGSFDDWLDRGRPDHVCGPDEDAFAQRGMSIEMRS